MKSLLRVLIVYATSLGSSAYAYSEPSAFAESVMNGGGGARYFTGSRAEGYTCSVCHTGAATPDVTINGLPSAGYVPGQVYRLTIDWSDELSSVALNVEATDFFGQRFGELIPLEATQLTAADRCFGDGTAAPVGAVELTNGRRILTVAHCGQQQTSLGWRAPTQVTRGWFTGSLVASDRKKDIDGDGVANFALQVAAPGVTPTDAAELGASCSARPLPEHADAGWVCCVLTMCAIFWRRRH